MLFIPIQASEDWHRVEVHPVGTAQPALHPVGTASLLLTLWVLSACSAPCGYCQPALHPVGTASLLCGHCQPALPMILGWRQPFQVMCP